MALDSVGEAVAMLSSDGHVRYANRVASDLFNADRGLAINEARLLQISNPKARESFLVALANCQKAITSLEQETVARRVALCSGSGGPLMMTMQAIDQELNDGHDIVAILFVSDLPSRSVDERLAVLRRDFGLSLGESQLAQQLSEGLLLKEIAIKRKVSYETVRSQLRRVMLKTGSRRQADVIRLLGSLGQSSPPPQPSADSGADAATGLTSIR